MTPRTFVLSGGARFEVSVDVLCMMLTHVQDTRAKREAGGVMMGRFLVGSEDIVVDGLTTPLPGDRRNWTFYYRAQKRHQAVIDRRWEESRGTCNYLGEWHTHPEPNPTPSCLDLRTWKRKLRQDQVDHFALFFVIVGQESVRAWVGDRQTLQIHPLTLWRS